MKIQVVSSIFDIQRIELDGRSLEFYASKIRNLLDTYPESIIFHNLNLSQIDKFKNDYRSARFIYISIESLPLAKFREEIGKAMIACAEVNEYPDLVHMSANYGIIINSKPFLMQKSFEISKSEYVMWIDAGISRFFENNKVPDFSERPISLRKGTIGLLDFDFRNFLRKASFRRKPFNWILHGDSTRVISGGILLLKSDKTSLFNQEFFSVVLKALRMGYWDTEQVNLYKLIFRENFTFSFVGQSRPVSILSTVEKKRLGKIASFFGNELIKLFIKWGI